MKREKVISIILSLICSGILTYSLFSYFSASDYYPNEVKVEFDVLVPDYDKAELFFENNKKFSEGYKSVYGSSHQEDHYKLSFDVPELFNPGRIRLDPGSKRGKWKIYSMKLTGLHHSVDFNPAYVYLIFNPEKHIKNYELHEDHVSFETTDNDPILLSRYPFGPWYHTLHTPGHVPTGVYILAIFGFIFLAFTFFVLFRRINVAQFSYQHIVVTGFLVILFLPALKFMIIREKDKSTAANLVYDKPSYDGKNLKKYIKQYAQFFETNFGFRKELFMLNGYYKYKLFNSSSRPEKVTIGKNGWVFYTDSIVWGDYQNKVLYTEAELVQIKNNLEELHTWHKNRGIDFYLTVFPNKANVYPEYLPYNISQKSSTSKIDQLRDFLSKNSFVQLIDVMPALQERKKRGEIYFKGDTHWNHEGAFAAYETIIDSMRYLHPGIFKIKDSDVRRIYSFTDGGDLYAQLGIDKIYKNEEFRPSYDSLQKSFTDYTREYGSQHIIMPSFRAIQKNKSLPKVVVYRDSFFGFMQPYFSESFSEVLYVWSTELSKEAIESEKPNIVLYAMIAGNIDRLLMENPEEIRKSVVPNQ